MDTEVIDWLTINFLPHEAELRRMLRRVCTGPAEIDDVVQETCFKLLSMPSLDQIRDPKPFVFRAAKNLVLDRIKRDAVVKIEAMANLEDLDIADSAPSPERVVFARSELKWVFGLVANLPDRCKSVFRARRIHGLSQQETADTLGLTASVVEHEMMKGMRLMSDMIARHGVDQDAGLALFIAKKPAGKKSNVKD
ncbi:MAG: RNA polymerase sigma factor [Massilia sp.]